MPICMHSPASVLPSITSQLWILYSIVIPKSTKGETSVRLLRVSFSINCTFFAKVSALDRAWHSAWPPQSFWRLAWPRIIYDLIFGPTLAHHFYANPGIFHQLCHALKALPCAMHNLFTLLLSFFTIKRFCRNKEVLKSFNTHRRIGLLRGVLGGGWSKVIICLGFKNRLS